MIENIYQNQYVINYIFKNIFYFIRNILYMDVIIEIMKSTGSMTVDTCKGNCVENASKLSYQKDQDYDELACISLFKE